MIGRHGVLVDHVPVVYAGLRCSRVPQGEVLIGISLRGVQIIFKVSRFLCGMAGWMGVASMVC